MHLAENADKERGIAVLERLTPVTLAKTLRLDADTLHCYYRLHVHFPAQTANLYYNNLVVDRVTVCKRFYLFDAGDRPNSLR